MNEFKPGRKVVELATGDEGFVLESPDWVPVGHVYVLWTTGKTANQNLHVDHEAIRLVNPVTISVQEALDVLIAAGYKVTLER